MVFLASLRKDCNVDVGDSGEPTNSMDFVHHPLASGRCMLGSSQDLFDLSMAGQRVATGVHCQCSGISCNHGECKVRLGIRLQVDRNAIHEDFNRSSGGVKVNDVSFEDRVSVINNLGLEGYGLGISSSKDLHVTSLVDAGLGDEKGVLGIEALKDFSKQPMGSGNFI